jgi:hypothetical protein
MAERVNAALVELVILALWLGAAAFFSFVVAPALFATLPSRTLAGLVVGRALPVVFYLGMAVGAAVVVLQTTGDRGVRDVRALCGCLMVAACAVAHFVIGRRIVRLREQIGAPIESLAVDDARRIAFGRLHGFSVAWLGLAMLAAGLALVMAWRATDPSSTR